MTLNDTKVYEYFVIKLSSDKKGFNYLWSSKDLRENGIKVLNLIEENQETEVCAIDAESPECVKRFWNNLNSHRVYDPHNLVSEFRFLKFTF